ncbi:PIG-L deacetylase family protein [Caenimonas koreensis]|uniref:PIG-L deacetylase family protein n=1 Tax=Caenimonas koreensis TaxID=367474 RepID=UPI003784BB7D
MARAERHRIARESHRITGESEPQGGTPLPVMLDLASARRVLVIAPHPDDETMGCGGTIALLAKHIEVQAVLVTNGDGAGELPPGTSETRKAEMTAALQLLGVTRPTIFLDEPDGHFADSPAFRARLAKIIEDFQPNWVFVPWLLDSHPDHWRIARASCAVLAGSNVEKILYYEIWTPLPATHVVDITSVADQKRNAVLCHATALKYGNYVEATFGLNAYRSIYVPSRETRYAEVFAVRTPADCTRTA